MDKLPDIPDSEMATLFSVFDQTEENNVTSLVKNILGFVNSLYFLYSDNVN